MGLDLSYLEYAQLGETLQTASLLKKTSLLNVYGTETFIGDSFYGERGSVSNRLTAILDYGLHAN